MNDYFKSVILQKTGASSLFEKEIIQELWSGYGKIIRIALENSTLESVVVKHVQLPRRHNHPRGWNTDIGHQRKLKSYEVETTWYKAYSKNCMARLPKCFAIESHYDETLMVLEDLDKAGFPLRKQDVTWQDIERCLEWLAKFHASYLGKVPNGLWEVGTYWHLETRPQELEALTDKALKNAAATINKKLNNCNFKTFVHGDAKLANFCFSENGEVAGVDFQYVGGGCGMKDVAYFIGSCLNENDCECLESKLLDTYFAYLHKALGKKNEALEKEWRPLYRVAWADFHRFLKGWSPSHWKINSYSERITTEVIKKSTLMDLQHLANIAIEGVLSAGKIIQKHMNDTIIVEKKEAGSNYASQVVTKVDRECERIILSHLKPTCKTFDIGLLSEETEDDGTRFEKDFFWCIDPLDGTLAFINKQPGFSVAIALIAKDGTPVIGVVFDPSTEIVYHAIKGNGVYKNRNPWTIKNTNDYLTYVTDKKLRDTPKSTEIQDILNKYEANLGLKGIKEISGSGAVLNAILVLENGPACFLKLPKKEVGGGSIWDFAATACIYQELGLAATNFNGGTLDLNKKDGTFMNHQGVYYSSFKKRS